MLTSHFGRTGRTGPAGFTSKLTNIWEWDNCRILSSAGSLTFLSPLAFSGFAVEMRLHRVMLAACMNCTRTYLSGSGNLYTKCLFGSVRTFSLTSLSGSRTSIRCWLLRHTEPFASRKLGLNSSRTYTDMGSNLLCSQRPILSGEPRTSTALGKETLLQGGATWPGKNEAQRTEVQKHKSTPVSVQYVRTVQCLWKEGQCRCYIRQQVMSQQLCNQITGNQVSENMSWLVF